MWAHAPAFAATGECGAECAGDHCAGHGILRDSRAPHAAPPRVDVRAFFFSSIFLVSYLVNFTLHGETRFNRFNHWWPFYWKLLASHIVLSTMALPLILITFFLSLTGRFPAHKKLARWTFPIWLYVSVTGVDRLPDAGRMPVMPARDTRQLLRTGLASS